MIVNRIRSGLAAEHRSLAFGQSDVIPPNSAIGGGGSVPIIVSESTALAIMTVMACVGLVSDVVGTSPIDTFTVSARGVHSPVEVPQVVDRPFVELERQDWIVQAMVSLLLRGNFYGLIIERDDLGFPMQVMPVHPDNVQVRRDRDTNRRVYKMGGDDQALSDVVHVPAIMVPQALVGLNPIQYARAGLGLAIHAEEFGSQFFQNGTHASGVISVAEELDADETLALARNWASAHQGLGKAHLPAVLTGGATWNQISVNPDDAQFLETRKFQKGEITMMFRVPPHKIGDVDKTTSWGTGIEQQEQGWIIDGILPWMKRLESMWTRLLPDGMYARFNLSGRLRGDTLQRYQAYQLARFAGFLNVDEIREKEDLPPLPDKLGQDYLQPMNYVTVEAAAGAQTPPPATPGPTGSDTP